MKQIFTAVRWYLASLAPLLTRLSARVWSILGAIAFIVTPSIAAAEMSSQ